MMIVIVSARNVISKMTYLSQSRMTEYSFHFLLLFDVLDARRCLFIGYDLGNIWKISSSNVSWFVKLHGYSHCFLVCLCSAHTAVFTLP